LSFASDPAAAADLHIRSGVHTYTLRSHLIYIHPYIHTYLHIYHTCIEPASVLFFSFCFVE
jgi:hypothetical protein